MRVRQQLASSVRRRPQDGRAGRRLAWFLPTALLAVAVLWPSPLAPIGLLGNSLVFLLSVVLATLAALHRPLGGATLGLGAVLLPAVVIRLGPVPAALVATLAVVSTDTLRATIRRHLGAPLRVRRPTDLVLGDAAGLGLATLIAAGLWQQLDFATTGWMLIVPPLAYGLSFGFGWLLLDRLRGSVRATDGAGAFAPLAIDLLGWGIGLVLVALSLPLAPAALWWLSGLTALLAAEAARAALRAEVAADRLDELHRLTSAHRRILQETSGAGAIAAQVLEECLNVLPVHTFQLQLLSADGTKSWTAGDDGRLVEGEPDPPDRPPMLPGIHRSTQWKIIEHPLEVEGDTLAILRLWCDPRRLEPGAEALLATLVPHMASSVHRARLDREAKRDPLTDLPVRRVLESHLQRLFRDVHDRGGSMAVILCDVDHFKRINDTWGHDAGDRALVAVARALDHTRREHDLCCRYGGEEFTVVLADASGEQALQLADRLRQAVADIELVYDGQPIPLRMSCGVAAFPELHVKTGSELILLADEGLYCAKENGRDLCLLHLGHGVFKDKMGRVYRQRQNDAEEPTHAPAILS
ncbi:MAG: diguanylate cyclase [Acidobacteriota bacterium]